MDDYSGVTDDELDEFTEEQLVIQVQDLLPPSIGRRRFIGALRGFNVQRWRKSECLRRFDPVGTALRWGMTIQRRKYYVPAPNSLRHIDSGH